MRVCPHCGHEEDSTRERCGRCGRSVLVAPGRLRGRRRAVVIVAAVLVASVVAVVLTLVAGRADSSRAARQQRDENRRAAVEAVRLRRLQAPHRGAAIALRPAPGATVAQRLRARAALRAAAEASITADARVRARRGELKGPVARSTCGPLLRSPDAVPDDRDLAKTVGRYDCIAIKTSIAGGGGDLGYPFVTALDFRSFTYVWCRNTPAQSERGEALAFVRLERACLAAKGRAVGTGYADVPGS